VNRQENWVDLQEPVCVALPSAAPFKHLSSWTQTASSISDGMAIADNNNSVALVRERTIPKLVPTFADRVCRVVSAADSCSRSIGFLDRSVADVLLKLCSVTPVTGIVIIGVVRWRSAVSGL
jgi:hypothetical protein